jgi:hypothetical protein
VSDNGLIAIVALATGIVIVLALWLTPRMRVPRPFFRGWRDFRAALRTSRPGLERWMMLVGLLASLWRPTIWGLLVLYTGLMGSVVWIIGGFQLPQLVQGLRELLHDVFDFLKSARQPAAANPPLA